MTFFQSIRTFIGSFGGISRLRGIQRGENTSQNTLLAAPVTFDSALSVSSWWAGCRLLTETVAGLPIRMYKRKLNVKTPDESHPLFYVLNIKPNRYQTKVEFFETLMLNLVMTGNCYAAIERVGGRIVSLLPLNSSQVITELLPDGSVIHTYYSGDNIKVYAQESMWHVKIFGNGLIGLSPISYAAQSLGIAIAAENRLTSIYKNGGKPTGILMIDKVLTKEQREAVRASMASLAEGNNDNLFVLEAGMKYEAVSMTPQDIELLESRRFQLEDVARYIGVPSVLINDTSGSTTWGSGIEQIIEGFYKLNLRPFLERFESSAKVHLLTPADSMNYEIEFDFDALLRMNQTLRFDGYNKGINGGVLTPNEARALEGWSPKEGGDTLLVNSTMMPIGQVGQRGANSGN
jgi:HK97 family phage portal protein